MERRLASVGAALLALGAGPDAACGAAAERPAYHVEPLAPGAGAVRALAERFTAEELALLEKLNRRDVAHLARARRIVVPDRWDHGELAHAPFPAVLPWAAETPKLVAVHLGAQAFGAYERGRLVRWGPVSSGGRDTPTPAGTYSLTWRSLGHHSSVDPDWYMAWYFNFDTERGLALHEYVLPGGPASHACVRLLSRDAVWLFGWGEEWRRDEEGSPLEGTGTPVLMVGQYDHDAPPPWLSPHWLARLPLDVARPAEWAR